MKGRPGRGPGSAFARPDRVRPLPFRFPPATGPLSPLRSPHSAPAPQPSVEIVRFGAFGAINLASTAIGRVGLVPVSGSAAVAPCALCFPALDGAPCRVFRSCETPRIPLGGTGRAVRPVLRVGRPRPIGLGRWASGVGPRALSRGRRALRRPGLSAPLACRPVAHSAGSPLLPGSPASPVQLFPTATL